MKVNTEHLHYWMSAIRESPDPIRTLDAFWQGQIKSKEWLIKELLNHVNYTNPCPTIDIHGGWVGVLASLLFQSGVCLKHINNIDIDPTCKSIAERMNQLEFQSGRFSAYTQDMCDFLSTADIIINTSCEHITQKQYDHWLNNLSSNSLLVLQSNNYNITEHIRIVQSLDEFKSQCKINVLWEGQLELPLYTRYMLIGKKNNE